MHPPPFDYVAFLYTPDLPPPASKARYDRPPPPRVLALGRTLAALNDYRRAEFDAAAVVTP